MEQLYEDVKLLLSKSNITIGDTEDEQRLFIMEVDGILESFMRDTRRTVEGDFTIDGIVTYPYEIKQFIADMYEYTRRPEVRRNLKHRSMGSVSYTYGDGLPAHLENVLGRYRRARFTAYKPLRRW